MSTGLSSLSKLSEISSAYPFAGMEYVYSAILLAFIILFFMWQTLMEQRHMKKIMGETSVESEIPSSAPALSPAE